jgi:hypothetical protein
MTLTRRDRHQSFNITYHHRYYATEFIVCVARIYLKAYLCDFCRRYDYVLPVNMTHEKDSDFCLL